MTKPLSHQQIRAFRAVVLTGTTVAAADMLNTTQPSVSRLIGQTQDATGLKLFVNERGRLLLTREGQLLFDTIQQHYRELERIEETVQALRASGGGIFRIACTPTLSQCLLPQVIRRFAVIYPNVHYHVATLGSREIFENLRRGTCDIGIANTRIEGDEFIVHDIETRSAVFIAATDHRLAGKDVVEPMDLMGETFIGLPEHDELTKRARAVFNKDGVEFAHFMETLYSVTVCAFVAENLGVSVMNPYMAEQFAQRLAIRPFSPDVPITTYAAFSRYVGRSELAERFLVELKKVVQQQHRAV